MDFFNSFTSIIAKLSFIVFNRLINKTFVNVRSYYSSVENSIRKALMKLSMSPSMTAPTLLVW